MNIKIDPNLPLLLEPWYLNNKRDLPWRKDQNPYHIWVSEIMLQQTRVEAVKGYYQRFLAALPDITLLANCPDDDLNKLWEGLGYYNRVRNMKKTANLIMQQYNGVFPSNYDQILSLPGIGEYTAGAICSIAYNQKTAAVDGNVMRVISRLLNNSSAIDLPEYKKAVKSALEEIYPEQSGLFTQALMELGATLCGPNRKPDCSACPCSVICKAYENNTAELLPVKSPKKAKREENITLFILNFENRYAISRRNEKGLLSGLWQFPYAAGTLNVKEAVSFVEEQQLTPHNITMMLEKSHIFTHIRWNMRGYYMTVQQPNDHFVWMVKEEIIKSIALPTAFRQFFDEIN